MVGLRFLMAALVSLIFFWSWAFPEEALRQFVEHRDFAQILPMAIEFPYFERYILGNPVYGTALIS